LENLLLTPTQVAMRLGIDGRSDIVADLLRRGLLPIAGQDEEGVPLVRQHHVERRGPALLARDFGALPSRFRRLAIADLPPPLPCGCAIDERDGPTFLCRTGRALEASAKLAQAFLAAAPADSFFKRLAVVTAEAFSAHLTGGERAELTRCHAAHARDCDAGQPALRRRRSSAPRPISAPAEMNSR
jgi:hypothetical protein